MYVHVYVYLYVCLYRLYNFKGTMHGRKGSQVGWDKRGIVSDMKAKPGLLGGEKGPEGEGRGIWDDPQEESVCKNAIMKSTLYAGFLKLVQKIEKKGIMILGFAHTTRDKMSFSQL